MEDMPKRHRIPSIFVSREDGWSVSETDQERQKEPVRPSRAGKSPSDLRVATSALAPFPVPAWGLGLCPLSYVFFNQHLSYLTFGCVGCIKKTVNDKGINDPRQAQEKETNSYNQEKRKRKRQIQKTQTKRISL